MCDDIGQSVVIHFVLGRLLPIGREEKGADVSAEVLGDCLQEGCEHEGEIVAWVKAMPEGAGNEGCKAGAETRLLAFGRYAQVHVIAEPIIRILVPIFEVCTRVLRGFDTPGVDVLQTVPLHTAGLGIDPFVAETGKDACAFGKVPDAVVFHSCGEAEHFEDPDTAEDAITHVVVAQDEGGVVPGREFQEEEDPDKTYDRLEGRWGAASRNFALFSRPGGCPGVCSGR